MRAKPFSFAQVFYTSGLDVNSIFSLGMRN